MMVRRFFDAHLKGRRDAPSALRIVNTSVVRVAVRADVSDERGTAEVYGRAARTSPGDIQSA